MIINAVGPVLGTQNSREFVAMVIQSIEPISGVWMIHVNTGNIKVKI